MQYFGGKYRLAPKLIPYIQPLVDKSDGYWEPFVGGASVFCHVQHPNKLGTDICCELIALYRHLQDGGTLPDSVSETEYQELKSGNGPDWLRGFVGFAGSFGGKWWGGYARNKRGCNYILDGRNSLLRRFAKCGPARFAYGDYRCFDFNLEHPIHNHVIYCDPPYKGTTGYAAAGKWNSDEFWKWVRIMGQRNCMLISEYEAPADIPLLAEFNVRTDIRGKDNKMIPRVERLYKVGNI